MARAEHNGVKEVREYADIRDSREQFTHIGGSLPLLALAPARI